MAVDGAGAKRCIVWDKKEYGGWVMSRVCIGMYTFLSV